MSSATPPVGGPHFHTDAEGGRTRAWAPNAIVCATACEIEESSNGYSGGALRDHRLRLCDASASEAHRYGVSTALASGANRYGGLDRYSIPIAAQPRDAPD